MVLSLAAFAVVVCGGIAVAQQPPQMNVSPVSPAMPQYRMPQGTGYSVPTSPSPTIRPNAPQPVSVGSAGRVLYYQKPADSLTATGMDSSRDVTQVSGTGQPIPGVRDTLSPPPLTVPPSSRKLELPPVAELPPPPPIPVATPTSSPLRTEVPNDPAPALLNGPRAVPAVPPMQHAKGKKLIEPPDCDDNPADQPKTPIPSPSAIAIMYDDDELERAIVQSLRLENPKLPPLPLFKQPGFKNNPRGVLAVTGGSMKGSLTHGTQFPELPCEAYYFGPYVAKTGSYPARTSFYAPSYVVHRRLHFEEVNSERYGWDLGFIQPFVSAAVFYKDLALWPNSLITGVCRGPWDTNAGKCLPGSPVPYSLYPPGLTISGSVFEAGLITGLAFFP